MQDVAGWKALVEHVIAGDVTSLSLFLSFSLFLSLTPPASSSSLFFPSPLPLSSSNSFFFLPPSPPLLCSFSPSLPWTGGQSAAAGEGDGQL